MLEDQTTAMSITEKAVTEAFVSNNDSKICSSTGQQ